MTPEHDSSTAHSLNRMARLFLAPVPLLMTLAGSLVANRYQPVVLGLPFFMFWIVFSVCLCSVVTGLVFLLDPTSHGPAGDDAP